MFLPMCRLFAGTQITAALRKGWPHIDVILIPHRNNMYAIEARGYDNNSTEARDIRLFVQGVSAAIDQLQPFGDTQEAVVSTPKTGDRVLVGADLLGIGRAPRLTEGIILDQTGEASKVQSCKHDAYREWIPTSSISEILPAR